jgi:PAS domain S-box-containing protein
MRARDEPRSDVAATGSAPGRFANLFDLAPVAYVTVGERARILEANRAAEALFGAAPRGLIGRSITALVGAAAAPVLREHLRRCLDERTRVEDEIIFAVGGEPPVIAQVVSAPFVAPDGQVTGCNTMFIDVTAIKRAQEKLQFLAQASAILASSFDYRATLAQVARQAVPILADICIVDLVDPRDGELRRFEVACADATRAERLGPFLSISPRADQRTAVGKVIRSREPLLFPLCSPESLASLADGYDHDILVKVSEARSMMVAPMVAHETVLGAITLIAAESGRRYSGTTLSTACDLAAHAALAIDNARLYERAQRAIRAREDVLAFVSHDMRNPLMGIQLTTETILRAARPDERRKGWKQLERIQRGVVQLRHMIDDLLDVASIDAGRLTVRIEAHEVKPVLDDLAATFQSLAADNNITLQLEDAADGLAVRCDRDRVLQVLSNLVGNAIKFTPAGGTVGVGVRAAGAHALFSVADTGPGIPIELRPRIFERYWQADQRSRHGRGLGLYIAKGLVEAQGGAIWVDSREEAGATFSFTLPLASAAER